MTQEMLGNMISTGVAFTLLFIVLLVVNWIRESAKPKDRKRK